MKILNYLFSRPCISLVKGLKMRVFVPLFFFLLNARSLPMETEYGAWVSRQRDRFGGGAFA
jgi:hypothetical protein